MENTSILSQKNLRFYHRPSQCPQCRVYKPLCFCQHLKKIANQIPVTILMHHREKALTSNTAYFAQKGLKSCSIVPKGLPHTQTSDFFTPSKDVTYLFLYPDEEALDLADYSPLTKDQKHHLIVPDGSWKQARKMKRRDKFFKDCLSVKISPKTASLYQLRKQHLAEGLCTLEAIAYALGHLDRIEVQEHLLQILQIMNQQMVRVKRNFGVR